MKTKNMDEITRILSSMTSGDTLAHRELIPLVYEELRAMAARKMAQERPGQTLQPTALVHEAYLRMLGANQPWQNRAHFFGAAAEAMRRLLIDNARRKKSVRHGGHLDRIELDEIELAITADEDHLLVVDEALDKLALNDPEAAHLVKLRFFAGMSTDEAANLMGLSVRSAARLWAYARAWLYQEISSHRQ